jgi:hypothetical protein
MDWLFPSLDDVGALDGGNGNHDDQLEEEEIKRPIKQRIPNEYEDKDNNNNGDDKFTQGELAHQQANPGEEGIRN